jgi:hypothetical protein
MTTYPALLTRAATNPEALNAEDHARLLPEDRAHLAAALRKAVASVDAQIAGLLVFHRTVTSRRADDLVRLARQGKLRVTALPYDEQQAIDNTPGLWDRLWQAWAS